MKTDVIARVTSPEKVLKFGRVAQLVEQVTFNHWVTGSNPVALTILYGSKSPKVLSFGGLFFVYAENSAKDNVKKSRK